VARKSRLLSALSNTEPPPLLLLSLIPGSLLKGVVDRALRAVPAGASSNSTP
jgi:hypothetical protein